MSTRLKLNVKNISSGFQNFSDVLGHESRIHNGFSRLVVPRSIPLRRPDCKYYKQDYVRRSSLDYAKLVLAPAPEKQSLKLIASEIQFSSKLLDTVHSVPACTPGKGSPWDSTYSFYYDIQNPQCPPPRPKSDENAKGSCKKSINCPDTPRPQVKVGTSCEEKSKPKTNPCYRKKCTFTVPLNFYRRFSSKCPPKGGSGGSGSDKGKPCKPKPCQAKKKKSKSGKGSACPPPKKVKDCPPKGKKGGKGSVCPPQKKVKGCPPKGGKKSSKGPTCPPPKKSKGCPPKKGSGGGRKKSGCPPKGKKSKARSACGGGKKKQKSSKSKSSCRPVLKKPRSCASKKSKDNCGPQGKPKKPKC